MYNLWGILQINVYLYSIRSYIYIYYRGSILFLSPRKDLCNCKCCKIKCLGKREKREKKIKKQIWKCHTTLVYMYKIMNKWKNKLQFVSPSTPQPPNIKLKYVCKTTFPALDARSNKTQDSARCLMCAWRHGNQDGGHTATEAEGTHPRHAGQHDCAQCRLQPDSAANHRGGLCQAGGLSQGHRAAGGGCQWPHLGQSHHTGNNHTIQVTVTPHR